MNAGAQPAAHFCGLVKAPVNHGRSIVPSCIFAHNIFSTFDWSDFLSGFKSCPCSSTSALTLVLCDRASDIYLLRNSSG